jgi:hypothetical protein
MKFFPEVLASSLLADSLPFHELGVLLGDTPSYTGGTRAEELRAAASEGRLEAKGGMVSRGALSRYLVAHGRPMDRSGSAFAWASGVVAAAGFDTAALRDFASAAEAMKQEGVGVSFKACFSAAQAGANARKFSGLAYDGGVIRDHAVYSPLVVDLAGAEFKTPAPAMFGHEGSIGVIDQATLGNQVNIEGRLFTGIDAKAKEISDKADQGMPWELSIRAYPGQIDQLVKGQRAFINGQTFTGPLTVFRQNRIREVSFCELGAASNTTARLH